MSVHFYTGSALLVLLVAASKHKHLDLTQTMLAWLDGFRIRAAYGMARKKNCKGLFGIWRYHSTKDVLEESFAP
jgi:hypothetical protein